MGDKMKFFLRFGNFFVLGLIILLAVISFYKTGYFEKIFDKTSKDEIIKSDIDKDNDGIDDYTDIFEGAKKFIKSKPKYKSKYYDGGYPTDEYRVCTDLIWYSLDNAGYDFKALIDEDIKNNTDEYDIDKIDQNIDFRRVRNILVYLNRFTKVLPVDDEFNPGDIVVYKNHIAIVSDKVNKKGINYIIHQHAYYNYEDDGLFRDKIIGHFRWELGDEDENI